MARKLEIKAPDAPEGCSRPGMEQRTYDIEVITPLFGGGAETGKNDPVTRVRVPGIRGQLRFWWRATRGAACANAAALRNREVEIWGDTDHPSKVRVRVEKVREGVSKPWPQGFMGSMDPVSVSEGCSFTLRVDYPCGLKADVEAAVWAWTNFGGIGARTRRGCGALYCKATGCEKPADLRTWLNGSPAAAVKTPHAGQKWAVLDLGGIFCKSDAPQPGGANAQDSMLAIMKDFRQKAGLGRNPGTQHNRPRRSRWPEADSARSISKRGASDHMTSITLNFGESAPAFPRAELGMPIGLKFIRSGGDTDNDCTINPVFEGTPYKRMGSPLLVRPIKCQNGDVLQAFVVLNHPAPDKIVLESKTLQLNGKTGRTRGADLATYNNSPMKGRSAAGSAVEAFLHFIERDKQFKKVL